jgi:hypothetical protein
MPSTASPTPDKLHDIDLERGYFSRTSAQDLTNAFKNFERENEQNHINHICVFFHGGLVTRSEGLDTAHFLINGYTNAGAYPFFFIWNSDLLSTLKDRIRQHSEDPVFATVVRHTELTVAGKIRAALDKQKLPPLPAPAKIARSGPRMFGQLAELGRAYDEAWAKRAGAQLGCSQRELEQFARFALSAEKAVPVKRRRLKLTRPSDVYARIIERFNTGHDHGLYTTTLEEWLIEFGLGRFGSNTWRTMQKFIKNSFDASVKAGGTAFVGHLCDVWNKAPKTRVTLIGHSAGSIYVQRMIEALNARLPAGSPAQLEIILLAPAISFARMNAGLSVLRKRVRGLRVFALKDEIESSYFEVWPYDKSLLYIVSSLCERDPYADRPLVGMQRYWSGSSPYAIPEIEEVTGFIEPPRMIRTVWALTKPNAKPGWRSQAKKHGEFPEECYTNGSVCHILSHGF